MAFADVEAKLTITGFSAADETIIKNTLETAYNGSATAKAMFDTWIATAGNMLKVEFVAGAFQALLNTGTIQIDLNYLTNANYINNDGKAVVDSPTTAILHEFVHAIENKTDNWNNVSEYRGDTVKRSNTIYSELGIDEQNSYIAYDSTGNILTRDREYTDGAAIDRSRSGNSDWNSGPAGNSKDLLIGGASANTLQSGEGNDFLFGAGGNDTLDGGGGATDTMVLAGKPTDYDIRLQADGTWLSRHVRGAANEGNDTVSNTEKVHFIDADQTFNLAKSGLTFQTDFSFVIDTTGSMSDDIAAVKTAATGVIDALFNNNTIDARINVVTYKDNTIGEPTLVNLAFTDQDAFADRKAAAVAAINGISVGGGGDFPETAFDGLLKALDGSAGEWRVGAGVKKLALFTDASAKDVFLLPQVLAYALDIGATISSSSSRALGDIGKVDTFVLSYGPEGTAQRDPGSEGDVVESPPLTPIITTPPFGPAIVQVTTIFISGFTTPDEGLTEVSEETGGSVVTASNPSEVVERLLEIITSSNYSISADVTSLTEGNSGATTITFSVARDRADEAATVELTTGGTANASDISGSVPALLSFAVDEFSKTFTIDVLGDTSVEPDETFSVLIGDISEPSTVIAGTAQIAILNDDGTSPPPPTGRTGLVDGVRTPLDVFGVLQGNGGEVDKIASGAAGERMQGHAAMNIYHGNGGNDTFILHAAKAKAAGAHEGSSRSFADQFAVIYDFEGAGVASGDFLSLVGFDPTSLVLKHSGASGTPGAVLHYYSAEHSDGTLYNFIVNSLTGNALGAGDFNFY